MFVVVDLKCIEDGSFVASYK